MDPFPEDAVEWTNIRKEWKGEPVVWLQVFAGSEFLLDQALKATSDAGCILLDRQQTKPER